MNKNILTIACILGLLSVAFGAFGAHGLEKLVTADAVKTFETGVRYQMYHALLLFGVGMLPILKQRIKKMICWLIVIGVLLFSFSIYLLALRSLLPFDSTAIAFLTPLGGLFLIGGWGTLGYSVYRNT